MAKSAVSKPGLKLRMVGNAAKNTGEGISNVLKVLQIQPMISSHRWRSLMN